MSDEKTEETSEKAPEQDFADGRPASQVEAEEGARDKQFQEGDPRLRAADIASSRKYAEAGIYGAPGSEADPGGDLPEPYPAEMGLTPSQAEAEGAEPQRVPGVEGAPGTEPGQDAGVTEGSAEERGQSVP